MMTSMVAIYVRVSSTSQKQEETIASQTSVLKEYAQTLGLVVPADWVFEDDGFSGCFSATSTGTAARRRESGPYWCVVMPRTGSFGASIRLSGVAVGRVRSSGNGGSVLEGDAARHTRSRITHTGARNHRRI